jgi:hypothetical protein
MSSVSSTSLRPRSPSRRDSPHRSCFPVASRRGASRAFTEPLARYLDDDGQARELLALPGSSGSVLVLDRDAGTLCDRRLIAHLAPDEPEENAALVCRHYLEDPRGRWCRLVRPEDLRVTPFPSGGGKVPGQPGLPDAHVQDTRGNLYRLGAFRGERSTSQLRWARHRAETSDGAWEQVKLRDVVAALESYEPVRSLTEQALSSHQGDRRVRLTRLGSEFERLCTSPIVLNRGLREAVLEAVEHRGMTMSEIALRCGIVKHDRRGNPSGETSWLARRVGLMPEGGASAITPWIHSDVLAAISRKGLGLSPREVELQ